MIEDNKIQELIIEGDKYYSSKGVGKDIYRAIKLYEAAIEFNCLDRIDRVFSYYFDGVYHMRYPQFAKSLANKMVRSRLPMGYVYLARINYYELSLLEYFPLSEELLHLARSEGIDTTFYEGELEFYRLKTTYKGEDDPESNQKVSQIKDIFQKCIDNGDKRGYYYLALLLEYEEDILDRFSDKYRICYIDYMKKCLDYAPEAREKLFLYLLNYGQNNEDYEMMMDLFKEGLNNQYFYFLKREKTFLHFRVEIDPSKYRYVSRNYITYLMREYSYKNIRRFKIIMDGKELNQFDAVKALERAFILYDRVAIYEKFASRVVGDFSMIDNQEDVFNYLLELKDYIINKYPDTMLFRSDNLPIISVEDYLNSALFLLKVNKIL